MDRHARLRLARDDGLLFRESSHRAVGITRLSSDGRRCDKTHRVLREGRSPEVRGRKAEDKNTQKACFYKSGLVFALSARKQTGFRTQLSFAAQEARRKESFSGMMI